MFETITSLVVASGAISEADRYEARGGRVARAKVVFTVPARLLLGATCARLAAGAFSRASAALGRERSPEAARIAGIWAGELALRGLSGPLAPKLVAPSWPRDVANAGAVGTMGTGALVFITAPLADLDEDAVRAVMSHELAHLRLAHVVIKGLALGLLAAFVPPVWRAGARRATGSSSPASSMGLVAVVAAASAVVSRRLESDADTAAASEGRGPALGRALLALETHNKTRAETGLSGALRRRLSPYAVGRAALALNAASDRLFASHPPTADRVATAAASI